MSIVTRSPKDVAETVRTAASALTGAPSDFDPVLDLIGNATYVLIGEASHGTHEFYRVRGEITKRLIQEHGFTAIAAEADWPDAYRVNRFVRGEGDDNDADDALSGFKRFPQWMWRNSGLGCGMDASRDLARTCKPMAMRQREDLPSPANRPWSSSYSNFAGPPQSTRGGMAGSHVTRYSMRNKMRGWCATPRSTIAQCSMVGSPRGTSATGTWPKP